MDGAGSTASSVVFQVYGDGNLLYQSPVVGYSSAAIPLDLNVAGVQKLTLVVEAASGSTVANDHAVWADGRLISTANFGSTTPYTLSWQLEQNGQVVSTQTADSFAFAALSGTYTLNLTVTDAQGDQATASTTVTVVPDVPTASLILKDSGTKGGWIGSYGTQGYDIPDEGMSLPAYASIAVSGATTTEWADTTSNLSGLREPDGEGAAVAAWTGSTFTIMVNLGDGQAHDLALYAVDWTNSGRSEQIQVINPATGAVLDTETLGSFTGGAYLQWVVSGDVEIKVTSLVSASAVVSGLFLDAPPSVPSDLVNINGTVQGNWVGTFGTQGYDLAGGPSSLPSYASISVSGANINTWAASTTDTRGLENPSGSGRTAITWASSGYMTINVDLTDGKVHDLSIYTVDWDNLGRTELVQLINPATGAVLSTRTVSSFSGGEYLQWAVTGDVEIKVTKLGGAWAAVSGVFLDAAPTTTSSSPPTGTLIQTDNTTEGNWIGTYGTQGYDLADGQASLPSYASITVTGASTGTWALTTADLRGLEDAGGSGRTADVWDSSVSFTINVTLTDGKLHYLSISTIDWDNTGRTELVQLINPATGSVLSTQTVTSFAGGDYLQWAVTGDVEIKVTKEGGGFANITGVFLDASPSTPAKTATTSASASLVGTNTTQQGNWIGTYGAQGYDLADGQVSLPSYANLWITGANTGTWASPTTDTRGLENAGGSGRTADYWAGGSITINLTLTDGKVHDVTLYAVDWDKASRVEQVQVINMATGAILSTQTVASFSGGEYLQFAVSGDVEIKVTKVSGTWATIEGIFFDPTSTGTTSMAAAAMVQPGVGASSSSPLEIGALNFGGDSDGPVGPAAGGTSSTGDGAILRRKKS